MNATTEELRAALERLRQAAEQYLDTEHRSDPRDADLRRNLSEAALHASFVLYPPSADDVLGLVVRAAGDVDLRSLITRPYVAQGGDDRG
jgi:hypothetical protein